MAEKIPVADSPVAEGFSPDLDGLSPEEIAEIVAVVKQRKDVSTLTSLREELTQLSLLDISGRRTPLLSALDQVASDERNHYQVITSLVELQARREKGEEIEIPTRAALLSQMGLDA